MDEKALPKAFMKLGGVKYYANVTGQAVDGLDGGLAYTLAVPFAGGHRLAVISARITGRIGKRIAGVNKGKRAIRPLLAAASLTEATFGIEYPSGNVWNVKGGWRKEAEKNGLPSLVAWPQHQNNPALTGIGQHVVKFTLSIQAVKPSMADGYDASSPNDSNWELVEGFDSNAPASAAAELDKMLDAQNA